MSQQPSLEYAMGQLAGQSKAQAEEMARHRDALECIPAKVVALMEPRMGRMEATLTDHEGRIRRIEIRDWKVYGGASVVLVIAGVLLGGWHPIHIPFLK